MKVFIKDKEYTVYPFDGYKKFNEFFIFEERSIIYINPARYKVIGYSGKEYDNLVQQISSEIE